MDNQPQPYFFQPGQGTDGQPPSYQQPPYQQQNFLPGGWPPQPYMLQPPPLAPYQQPAAYLASMPPFSTEHQQQQPQQQQQQQPQQQSYPTLPFAYHHLAPSPGVWGQSLPPEFRVVPPPPQYAPLPEFPFVSPPPPYTNPQHASIEQSHQQEQPSYQLPRQHQQQHHRHGSIPTIPQTTHPVSFQTRPPARPGLNAATTALTTINPIKITARKKFHTWGNRKIDLPMPTPPVGWCAKARVPDEATASHSKSQATGTSEAEEGKATASPLMSSRCQEEAENQDESDSEEDANSLTSMTALDGLGFPPHLRPSAVSEADLKRRRQEVAQLKKQKTAQKRERRKEIKNEKIATGADGAEGRAQGRNGAGRKPGGGGEPRGCELDDDHSHKYYCGVCELYEVSKPTFGLHQRKHTECAHPGCTVVGTPQVLLSHYQFAHGAYAVPGYHMVDMRLVPTTEVATFRILAGEDKALVDEWLWERRARYPTRARLAELQAVGARKRARMERLEARLLAAALDTGGGGGQKRDLPPPMTRRSNSSTSSPSLSSHPDECVWFCDACEIDFKSDEAFLNHLEDHVPCVARACNFAASRDMVARHYEFCHGKYAHRNGEDMLATVVLTYWIAGVLGQTFEIPIGNDSAGIEAWLKERKQRFPVVLPAPGPAPILTTHTSSASSRDKDEELGPGGPQLASGLAAPTSRSSLGESVAQEGLREEMTREQEAGAGLAQSAQCGGTDRVTHESLNNTSSQNSTGIANNNTFLLALDHPERMRRFYALYQPSKIAVVPALWQLHQHEPAVMWAALFDKYKVPEREQGAFFVQPTALPTDFLKRTASGSTKRTAPTPATTGTDDTDSSETLPRKRVRT